MTHPTEASTVRDNGIPMAIVKKMRWPYPLIWIVPLLAAVGAGFYLYEYFQTWGTKITISFTDGNGLKSGETKVLHRGVEVGEVQAVELSADKSSVLVRVRLQKNRMNLPTLARCSGSFAQKFPTAGSAASTPS